MDPFTHAAVGALAGVGIRQLRRQQVKHSPDQPLISLRHAMLLGAVAGILPDIDIISYFVNPLHYHAYWHGTYTHSLILAPLWAALFAVLIIAMQRWGGASIRAKGTEDRWLIYWIGLAGILSHIGLDVITAWDVGIWLPLSPERVSFGLIFLVDLVFSGSILLGLWAVYRAWKPWVLIGCLFFAVGWLGFAYQQKQEALTIAASTHPHVAEQLTAWPQPFSVFHWKLISIDDHGYWQSHVRVTEQAPLQWPLASIDNTVAEFVSPQQVQWQFYPTTPHQAAQEAWQHPEFQAVRDFMTYPAYVSHNSDGCVWFTDLLFTIPEQSPPFTYGLCAGGNGQFIVVRKPILSFFSRLSD